MKEIIIEIRFFNITYRWEVDENYRNEYLEENELTELKKIEEYKVEYSRSDYSKLAYYYFATKYHIIPPDDLFFDYNDYTDEGEIEVLKEILEELTPEEISTFEFEVSFDYAKRKKTKAIKNKTMNKTELKLKVIELSKTLKRNELYDYIIAKYLISDRESNGFISVADIEYVTGLKISDVVMMNKLLFYWTTMLDEVEQKQKAINILTVMDFLSKEEQNEIIRQHRIKDELMFKIYQGLTDESNNAA